jgi:hypothetical protein
MGWGVPRQQPVAPPQCDPLERFNDVQKQMVDEFNKEYGLD